MFDLCACCSVCSNLCKCPFSISDQNKKMENILLMGDENYRCTICVSHKFKKIDNFRITKDFYGSLVLSDDSEYSDELDNIE